MTSYHPMNINDLGAMAVSSVVKSSILKNIVRKCQGKSVTKYNDIKRVRDIKTLVRDTRQVLSVNGSVTLATT